MELRCKSKTMAENVDFYYDQVTSSERRYSRAYICDLLKVSENWVLKNLQKEIPYIRLNKSYLKNCDIFFTGNRDSMRKSRVKFLLDERNDIYVKKDDKDFGNIYFSIDDVINYILNNSKLYQRSILVNYADLITDLNFKNLAHEYRVELAKINLQRGESLKKLINEYQEEYSDQEILNRFFNFEKYYPQKITLPNKKEYEMKPFFYKSVCVKIEKIDKKIKKTYAGRSEVTPYFLNVYERQEITKDILNQIIDVKKIEEIVDRKIFITPKEYRHYEMAYRDEMLSGLIRIEFESGKKTWFTNVRNKNLSKKNADGFELYHPIRYDDFKKLKNYKII